MIGKNFIYILIFYFLVLFQTSFFVHFPLHNLGLAVIFALFCFIVLKKKRIETVILALILGFFLDIYSDYPVGFYMAILALTSILAKIFIKNYVRTSFGQI